MTMVWPRCLSVADASARIATSVVPPAGHGTTNVTGRVGKFCAWMAPPNSAATSAAAKALIIALPPDGQFFVRPLVLRVRRSARGRNIAGSRLRVGHRQQTEVAMSLHDR